MAIQALLETESLGAKITFIGLFFFMHSSYVMIQVTLLSEFAVTCVAFKGFPFMKI